MQRTSAVARKPSGAYESPTGELLNIHIDFWTCRFKVPESQEGLPCLDPRSPIGAASVAASMDSLFWSSSAWAGFRRLGGPGLGISPRKP